MNLWVANAQEQECRSILITGGDEGCGAGCSYCGVRREGAAALDEAGLAGWLASGQPVREIGLVTAGYPGCGANLCRLALEAKRGGAETVTVSLGPGAGRKDIDFAALAAAGVAEVSFSLAAAVRCQEERLPPCPAGRPDGWDACREMAGAALETFGAGKVAVSVWLGPGDTEQSALLLLQKASRLGVRARISPLAAVSRGRLLRVLAGLHILVRNLAAAEEIEFGDFGQVINFGLAPDRFVAMVTGGEIPFSAYLGRDCANFGQPPAFVPGTADGGDILRQLCEVDWEEAWMTQRRLYKLDELAFDDEEIEAESGSVYAMIAAMGKAGLPK